MQGYDAQAVTTCEQIIVTAELTQDANDLQQLEPVLTATAATLAAADIKDRPETLAADSGYWSIANLTEIPDALVLLIPPPKHSRHGKPRKDGKPSASRNDGLRAAMTAKLQSEDGKACFAMRKETVEPVFAQIKEQQGALLLLHRGMAACQAEWKLLCGTDNLLCGGTSPSSKQPGRPPLERLPGELPRTTTAAIDQPPEPSPEVPEPLATVGDTLPLLCATACLVPDKHQAGSRHARNSGTRAKRERLCSA